MTELSEPGSKIREFRQPVHFSLSADRGWGQRLQLAATDLKDGVRLNNRSDTLSDFRFE